MATAKTGLARVACTAGAPILPVAITGTEQLSHMQRILRGRFKLTLTVGPLLEVEQVTEPGPELLRTITDEVMSRIAGLLPTAYRGVYGP
jgi:1-acyl-sn-glycerol-3-phosphate acyltransferase